VFFALYAAIFGGLPNRRDAAEILGVRAI